MASTAIASAVLGALKDAGIGLEPSAQSAVSTRVLAADDQPSTGKGGMAEQYSEETLEAIAVDAAFRFAEALREVAPTSKRYSEDDIAMVLNDFAQAGLCPGFWPFC